MVKLLSYLGFWLGSGAFCSDGLLWQTGSLCPQETCLTSPRKRQPVGKTLLVSNGALHTKAAPSILVGVLGVASCRGTTGLPVSHWDQIKSSRADTGLINIVMAE